MGNLALLEDRVTALENIPPPQFESYATEIEDIMNRLHDHDKMLTEKVGCDTYDNEIASLREMIGNIEPDDNHPIVVNSSSNLPKPL
jgi:hypothetical protein